jgi:hypothetical protein
MPVSGAAPPSRGRAGDALPALVCPRSEGRADPRDLREVRAPIARAPAASVGSAVPGPGSCRAGLLPAAAGIAEFPPPTACRRHRRSWHNITNPLTPVAGKPGSGWMHQPLRAHLAGQAALIGLPRRLAPPGSAGLQRLGDITARPPRQRGSGRGAARRAARGHPVSVPLAVIEDIIDASGVAPAIEAMLPAGVRGRQLPVRTLLAGMMLTAADGRPAHLTRVRRALLALPEADQARLGVTASWKKGPHHLTYRQTEHTFRLMAGALARTSPTAPRRRPCRPPATSCWKPASPPPLRTAARRWLRTGPTWRAGPGRPATAAPDAPTPKPPGATATPTSKAKGEMFFGYYLSAVTMAGEENGPPVPELARRMTLCSCAQDPARALVPVLQQMPADGIPLGDLLADSGYSHRVPADWAIPLRQAGAVLIQDLHPHDRGPRGTHQGAVITNGNLYCPKTPPALLRLAPLPPGAAPGDTAAHDQQTAELARHKLGRHTADDADGYHRVTCPAAAGKIRCPLRPASMTLDRDRPEILTPPGHPPACCTQPTITVAPDMAAKTRQKHDYPSQAWRRSYARRTAAERSFSPSKTPPPPASPAAGAA